ncbi:hypothetical protein [Planomicrobium sp. YIM 101495]|uniref:hypothetical protein n=1 Tax=Planomicrobium sp. YIM 101495 TaxID=2665160 RepID=UPI0012B9D1F5|nr:hypothetical protein [Planomicrobium sp. YIM 101495]MTD31268.1 hypothetical protein [Planomicrobium sp. YIM 101495]
MTETRNVVAYSLYGVGVLIIIINLFRAFSLIDWVGGQAAFEVFLQGVIVGVLFIGFGELLRLLQGMFNQREPELPPEAVKTVMAGGYRVLQETDEQEIHGELRKKVENFYLKKGLVVEEMEATPYEGYIFVHRFGKRDIVDMNGFKPEILSQKEIENHPDLKDL